MIQRETTNQSSHVNRDHRLNIQHILDAAELADREVHVVLKGHTDALAHRVLEGGEQLVIVGRGVSGKPAYGGER
jgi:hypothetical protein